RAQIAEILEIAPYILNRGERIARQLVEIRAAPLLDDLATAFYREPVAKVVRKDDREAREALVFEISAEADQVVADRHPIAHVAVEDELAVRAALIGQG